ncbi:hypothetical protein HanOQP8_Chr04g0147201 [Helianthus annuus]|nr:hypothetical protein HanHA89_Chr04g0147701 [Helianthus annuus]KAJ0757527.1 hypothetical protein HanLR1_Chr04g0139791 [Helianthus annuus]KAJ0761214.1 hypothetical protein HanOQP8_Chr04g0147201 [Helianthus annuus]
MLLSGLAFTSLDMFQVLCVSRTPLCFIEVCLFILTYSIQVPRLYSNFAFLSLDVGVSSSWSGAFSF